MKFLLMLVGIGALAVCIGVLRRTTSPPTRRSSANQASMMDSEPEAMSLFSADHVRMLSEAQLQAMEREEDDL